MMKVYKWKHKINLGKKAQTERNGKVGKRSDVKYKGETVSGRKIQLKNIVHDYVKSDKLEKT